MPISIQFEGFPTHPPLVLFSSQLFRAIPALKTKKKLVCGFNPSEKYESQLGWWHSQCMGENKIYVPNHQPEKVTCFPHQQPITWCAPTPTPPIPARAGCQHRAASGGGCWSRWRGACGEDLWKPMETCLGKPAACHRNLCFHDLSWFLACFLAWYLAFTLEFLALTTLEISWNIDMDRNEGIGETIDWRGDTLQ